MRPREIMMLCSLMLAAFGGNVAAETHTINAQTRIFAPDVLYVQPGDTIGWTNMPSHNTVSYAADMAHTDMAKADLLPEGAKGWRGDIGENLKVTLDIEGVYPYYCEPHIGFGMTGVIVVGEPVNIDAAMEAAKTQLQGPFRRVLKQLLKVQRAISK